MTCSQCGNELVEHEPICSKCGHEVLKQDMESVNDQADLTEGEEISLFLEEKQEYFLKKWEKKDSWNWAGFFLSYFWLGYRKMYDLLFIMIGLFLFAKILSTVTNLYFIDSIVALAINIFVGIKGNGLYKSHVKKKLETISLNVGSPDEKVEKIKETGGVSYPSVLVPVAFFVVFSMVMTNISFSSGPAELVFGTGYPSQGITEERNSFSQSEQILAEAQLRGSVGESEIRFIIFKLQGRDAMAITDWSASINPKSDYFRLILLDQYSAIPPGQYIVHVLKNGNVLIAEGEFTIQ